MKLFCIFFTKSELTSDMSIELKFFPNTTESQGQCVYHQDDLTLSYEQETGDAEFRVSRNLSETLEQTFAIRKVTPTFLIADTLTLTFDGAERKLVALDAYTNRSLWKPSVFNALPNVNARGSLYVNDPLHIDHYSLNITPSYEESICQKWVRIVLDDAIPTFYCHIGHNLIAGFLQSSVIDLFLVDVQFV